MTDGLRYLLPWVGAAFLIGVGFLGAAAWRATRPWKLDKPTKWGAVSPDTVRQIEASQRRSGGYDRVA